MTINTELAKQVIVQPYYVGTKNDDVYLCTWKYVFNILFNEKKLQNHFRIPFKNTKHICLFVGMRVGVSQRLHSKISTVLFLCGRIIGS